MRLAPFLALLLATAAFGQEPPLVLDPAAAEGAAEVAESSGGVFRWLVLLGGIGVIGVLAFVGKRFAAMITLVTGLGLVFAGERLFGGGTMHLPLTGLGALAVIASLGMRLQAMISEDDASRVHAQRIGLITAAVTASSLALYALSTPLLTEPMGITSDTWTTILWVLTPIVMLCGLLPTLFIDRVLAENPVMVPTQAPTRAAIAGLSTALALALLFPLNYAANDDGYGFEVDYSYFRVTDVGTRTLGVARSLSEPVAVTLYYPAGSDVRNKVEPYFRTLQAAAGDMMSVQTVDHAVRPDLAEEHEIRENGWVVFTQGESKQKFEIGIEMNRAKRKLTKLDATVTKHLLKLTSDAQVAYFLSGHGEASWRERDNPGRKLSQFKRDLEDLNFSVKTLGVTEGSAVAVPDDAALVVVAAPMIPLFSEEEQTLIRYLERGGALLVMVDPGSAPIPRVMEFLGVEAGQHPVAHENAHLVYTGGIADRILVATNRFGTHPSTRTISRNSSRNPLALPTALALTQVPDTQHTLTTLIRSYPDSWEDTNNNRQLDPSESGQVFEFAIAAELEDGFRAAVIGDVAVFSEVAYENMQANADFAADLANWLVGEDALIGETEREEDVEIRHTRDDDKAWFWGTILGVPLLILALGGIIVNIRRRRS